MCLKAFCSFCLLCLKILLFFLCFVLFCPAVKGKEVSFQKRKKVGRTILWTHLFSFLGVNVAKLILSGNFLLITETVGHRAQRDHTFYGQWRRGHGHNLYVTISDSGQNGLWLSSMVRTISVKDYMWDAWNSLTFMSCDPNTWQGTYL